MCIVRLPVQLKIDIAAETGIETGTGTDIETGTGTDITDRNTYKRPINMTGSFFIIQNGCLSSKTDIRTVLDRDRHTDRKKL